MQSGPGGVWLLPAWQTAVLTPGPQAPAPISAQGTSAPSPFMCQARKPISGSMKSGAVIRSGCLGGARARRARSSRQVPSDPRRAVARASRAEACAEARTGASAAGQRTREDRLISTEALEQLGRVGLESAGLFDLQ